MSGKLHSKDFLIGFDSDGCAFDNMTVKHQRCFGPAFVECYDLEAIAPLASRVWDFVNLYSRTRGCNRFRGVINSIHLLKQCANPPLTLPSVSVLEDWANQTTNLSNKALEEAQQQRQSAELTLALHWSCEVNRRISGLQIDFPPIAGVREALAAAGLHADLAVISQAPSATVEHEWSKHKIDGGICRMCGQEYGSKAEQLRSADQNFYAPGKILLVGDAPGDRVAAETCGALFYPIVPGAEAASWKKFREEALDRFFTRSYAGDYQKSLLADFESALPEKPDFLP